MDKRNTKACSRLKQKVDRVLGQLYGVHIETRGIRKYQGSPKVKVAAHPWLPEGVPVYVCDESGEQEVVIRTDRRPAIARIVLTRLEAAGIPLG